MKVLVTGASGLLGGAVASELASAGHGVFTFQRSPSGLDGVTDRLGTMTSRSDLARAVDGVDAIVHLAARVSLAGPAEEFRAVNVDGTAQLIEAATRSGVPRLVFVSSPSVAHFGVAIAGDDARPADPDRARGEYARSKAEAEVLALDADSDRLAVVAVRPHLVWGPGDTQLVGRIVERARRGRLPILGTGTALIDTTYIDTAASGICAALGEIDRVHGNSYVVTNGEPRPVAELLGSICRAAGVPAPKWSVPASVARAAGSVIERAWGIRPGLDEPPMTRFLAEQLSTSHWFDQRRTRSDLRWMPPVTLDDGFARLARQYGR